MHLIVGLGNPGLKYKNTRHNIGFMALDRLAKEKGLKWRSEKKFDSEIAENGDTLLVKPQTYMNLSGDAVRKIFDFYHIGYGFEEDLCDTLTVIHDDLDIELGKYKISTDSRSAGHNGVQSIIDNLKTKKFKRIRIGIKTPELEVIPAERFVLGRLEKNEKIIFKNVFLTIAQS